MRIVKVPQSSSIRFRNSPVEHWKDARELHQVMHRLPGYFRALLLDLINNPMTERQLIDAVKKMELQMSGRQKRKFKAADIHRDINFSIQSRVIEIKDEKYVLTPGGLEIARHMNEVIPLFFNTLLSTTSVIIVTVFIHIFLSVIKLVFGFLSGSAGLIADGIDNTVDTVSSILVWLGIKYQKDKIVSSFIMLMMAISVVGIFITGINKFLHPEPVREGVIAFAASAVSGFVMLLLSAYQYITGKKTDNFAILCQSVDARNHFLTSLLVCAGILTTALADVFNLSWLYYADAIAAMVIGILIAKGTYELVVEFLKPEDNKARIPHFVEKARRNMKLKVVYQWLSNELKDRSLGYNELLAGFEKQFCEQIPKIHTLTGIGYLPKTGDELKDFLDTFIKEKKIIFEGGTYKLRG